MIDDLMMTVKGVDDAALSMLALKQFGAQVDPVTGQIAPLPTQQAAMGIQNSVPEWVWIGAGAVLVFAMLKK